MSQLVLLRSVEAPVERAADDIPRWPPAVRLAFIAGCVAASWGAVVGLGIVIGRLI